MKDKEIIENGRKNKRDKKKRRMRNARIEKTKRELKKKT